MKLLKEKKRKEDKKIKKNQLRSIKAFNKQEIENEIQFLGMTSAYRNKEDAENIIYRDKSN